jgi:hypothetical protein
MMTQEEEDKFQVGKWYKDAYSDFIKFNGFSGEQIDFTARIRNGEYWRAESSWNTHSFNVCTPMTIDEMKRHLPESECIDRLISIIKENKS